MAITFQRAPTIYPGDPVISSQLAKLAKAVNDRPRSGLGDATYRIFFYLFSLFRQMRNPDESGYLWPSQAEFYEVYQMLNPGSAEWPVAGPGDPEGANLANPLNAWVFGLGNVPAESERIYDMGNGEPNTVAGWWEMARMQRGAYDSSTGAMASPAYSIARSHYQISPGRRSPHLRAYGGFMPTPEVQGDCGDGTPDQAPTPNLVRFWTNIQTSAVQTYPGTCPDEPTHIAWVAETDSAYLVWRNNGTADFFPKSQWIEGPYHSGASLQKQPSGALDRVLNKFASEFRGSDSQRGGQYNLDHAFDFEGFLSSHYRLAPAYGTTDGGSVVADYPLFRFAAPASAPYTRAPGTEAILASNSETQYVVHEGFVFLGCRITATGLQTEASIGMYDGETRIGEVIAVPTGCDTIVWIDHPAANAALQVRLESEATFTGATGKIEIECLETLDMHPSIPDLCLVLRLGSANDTATVDGSGIDFDYAREIGEIYAEYGCVVVGFLPLSTAAVNGNGIYDAARRLSQFVRCIPRANFIGYAVENGKSICWFKRHALGLDNETPVDLFAGIADAIAHTAPPQGWTNEWLMGVQTKVYHPSESSIWKPSAYSDWLPLNNRCLFYSGQIYPNHPDLTEHLNYGQKLSMHPEAPSGYNYVHGINNGQMTPPETKAAFYSSCQIYAPDPEIETAEALTEDGIEVVKITFKTRFQNTYGLEDGAPESIARGDYDTVETAPLPRTTENALRMYLRYQATGVHAEWMTGDSALESSVQSLTDNPFGSVFPHFFFVKLIPSPYEDGNDDQDAHDTDVMHDVFHQIGLYLQAMSSGCVDGATSAAFGCECIDDQNASCALFDYSWPNLCMDAFGNRWTHSIPQAPGTNIEGFGPLPNTYLYSEIFNQFSAIVNKLNRVRVMVPFQFQFRTDTYVGDQAVSAAQGTACTASTVADYYEGVAAVPTTLQSEGDWADEPYGASAEITAKIVDGSCSSGQWILRTTKTVTHWRYNPISEDVLNAIPETWRDMVLTNLGTLVKYTVSTDQTSKAKTSDVSEGSGCCFDAQKPCPGFYSAGGGQYWIFDKSAVEQSWCRMESQGTLDPEALGSHIYTIGRSSSGAPCFSSATNSINVVPINVESIYLEVPLVD